MVLEKKNILIVCSGCGSIKISDDLKIWLKERNNSSMYHKLLKRFNVHPDSVHGKVRYVDSEKISHGICPPCIIEIYGEDAARKINLL